MEKLVDRLLLFIRRSINEYIIDPEYKYCLLRDDIIVLVPNHVNKFIESKGHILELKNDMFKLMGVNVYFTSPHKNSIIIFDKRYYKDARVIQLSREI